MAYYLTDPYYYLPKSYPFIGNELGYPPKIYSHRPTSLGRNVESSSSINRLELSTRIFEDSSKC